MQVAVQFEDQLNCPHISGTYLPLLLQKIGTYLNQSMMRPSVQGIAGAASETRKRKS